MRDLAAVKEAVAVSRQARGLTYSAEAIDKVISAESMTAMLIGTVLFYVVVVVLLVKNAGYFASDVES